MCDAFFLLLFFLLNSSNPGDLFRCSDDCVDHSVAINFLFSPCFSVKNMKENREMFPAYYLSVLLFMTGRFLENMTVTSPPVNTGVNTGVNTRKHRLCSTQQKAFTQFLLQFTPLLTELYMSVQDITRPAPSSKVLPGT